MAGSQPQTQTEFPDTVTSTDPGAGYAADQSAYQDTQNY